MQANRWFNLVAIAGLVCGALADRAGPCRAAEFHVAADGRKDGDGSRERPWDLATALAHPESVRPGDTLWLHGGTYRGVFASRLQGTADKPIVVRQAPGERATLDAAGSGAGGSTLQVHGAQTWFQGFEITNSSARRVTKMQGPHPADLGLNGSVDVYSGAGHKLINLVVHHCSGGPGATTDARGTEAYGNIVFNNGWDAPDRGHGHAFYWQNDKGTKRIAENVFFNQFSHGIHCYGSSRAFLNNFHIEGNIAFNNGAMSKRSGFARNYLVGGGRLAENITVAENYSYFPRGGTNVLGYGRGCDRLTVTGNYFATPDGNAVEIKAKSLSLRGNTFFGHVPGVDAGDHPDNTFLGRRRPGGAAVFVRPNRYERGRAHVVVYNWALKDAVEIDLSKTGLERGEAFEVRDVQNYFGRPVATGRYEGKPVSVTLKGLTVADPVGDVPIKPAHTGPEFAVFVVRKAE